MSLMDLKNVIIEQLPFPKEGQQPENPFDNSLPVSPPIRGIFPPFGKFPPGLRPVPRPPFMPGPILEPEMPDYSSQFEKLGETLGGFGEQLGGFGKQIDALGSFNEQVGGLVKQFEALNNKLDSLEKGLGSLCNQLASIEQGQSQQVQQVQQPQRPFFSPFGLGGLFMNFRRF